MDIKEETVLENSHDSAAARHRPKNTPFKRVALLGRQRVEGIEDTLLTVRDYLLNHPVEVVLESDTADIIPSANIPIVPRDLLSQNCDLLIVVGGDGSMLNAAHIGVESNLPVLGINRGRLGFLTDIRPDELYRVNEVLEGKYIEEKRFLLDAVIHGQEGDQHILALNDVVLLRGNIPHMIEFEVRIDDQIISTQRADGMIIATPTGSTAYALSGGGPILHPQLDAIVLVPMYPHTLSSRPIVVKGDSKITLIVSPTNECSPWISGDGQDRITIEPGGSVVIKKKQEALRLIHPLNYNYYQTLREKLGWEK